MGFKRQNVSSVIPIPFNVDYTQETPEGEIIEEFTKVVHFFKRPTPAERESFAEKTSNSPIRGRRNSPTRIVNATWDFWMRNVIKLEGYDDPDIADENGKCVPDFREVFKNNNVLMEHVQAAVYLLLTRLGAEEAELTKKSESLPERSLTTVPTVQKIREK